MTESEWLTCVKVTVPVMDWLRRQGGRRKFRLAGCAAVRHVWDAIDHPHARALVEMCEEVADGLLEAQRLQRPANAIERDLGVDLLSTRAQAATRAALYLAMPADYQAGYSAMAEAAQVGKRADQWSWQCRLLRDIFSNPFRPASIQQAWLTWKDGTIPNLARAAYDKRELPGGDFDASKLAILADALEEAGCASEEMLGHLRGPGPHVRGCWAVDLLLGKN
ncbi:MAG: hypothetical protein AB7K24_28805 [Gemmataceae bacterium]